VENNLYQFVDESTILLGPANGSNKPQRRKIVFHSNDEFSFGGAEPHFLRIGPGPFGGIEEKRLFLLPNADHDSVALSKNRKFLFASNGPFIRVFDTDTGAERPVLKGHDQRVSVVNFLPDGTLASVGHDETLRIWDVNESKLISTFAQGGGPLHAGTFTPDGKYAATTGTKVEVNLFDLKMGKEVAHVHLPNNVIISSLVFSPDGTSVVGAGSHRIVMWNVPGLTEKATFPRGGGFQGQTILAFSPDSRLLAIGTDHVTIYDATTHAQTAAFTPYRGQVRAMAFSPDGKTLAVASGKWVRLWDVATSKEGSILVGHIKDVQSLSWSADSRFLATGAWDKTVRLWSIPPR
jgi:WD40 repeat protein